MRIGKYNVTFRRGALIHGQRGYEYEVFEPGRTVATRGGWTAGNRQDAEQEARRAVRELEARNTNASIDTAKEAS